MSASLLFYYLLRINRDNMWAIERGFLAHMADIMSYRVARLSAEGRHELSRAIVLALHKRSVYGAKVGYFGEK